METDKTQDHLLKRALLWRVQPPVETERFGELSGSSSNPRLVHCGTPGSNSGFQQRDPNRSWFNQNKFLSDFLSLHPEAPFFSSSCYPSYVPFTSLISNHFIFTFTITSISTLLYLKVNLPIIQPSLYLHPLLSSTPLLPNLLTSNTTNHLSYPDSPVNQPTSLPITQFLESITLPSNPPVNTTNSPQQHDPLSTFTDNQKPPRWSTLRSIWLLAVYIYQDAITRKKINNHRWMNMRCHQYCKNLKLHYNRRNRETNRKGILSEILSNPTTIEHATRFLSRNEAKLRARSLKKTGTSEWMDLKNRLTHNTPQIPKTSKQQDSEPATPHEPLVVLSWNAGSLSPHKLAILEGYTDETNADVVLIQETWLATPPNLQEYWTASMTEARIVPGSTPTRGGLWTGVKGKNSSQLRHANEALEFTTTLYNNITIVNIYLAHTFDTYDDAPLVSAIKKLTDKKSKTIICGDFNVDLNGPLWKKYREDPELPANDSKSLRARTAARLTHSNMAVVNPKKNGVYEPTHHFNANTTPSSIDWCLVSKNLLSYTICSIIPAADFGHRMMTVEIQRQIKEDNRLPPRAIMIKKCRSFIRRIENAKSDETKAALWDEVLDTESDDPSLDNASEHLLHCLTNQDNIPKERDPLFMKWKRIVCKLIRTINLSSSITTAATLKNLLNHKKNRSLYSKLKKIEKEMKLRAIMRSSHWTHLRERKGQSNKILTPQRLSEDEKNNHFKLWDALWNKTHSDDQLDEWLNNNDLMQPWFDNPHSTSTDISNEISLSELKEAIHLLQNNKAPGPKYPIVELYKTAPDHILRRLLKTFNNVLTTKEYPRSWQDTSLILINKQPPLEDPANYRPINLTEIPFRILEKVLAQRLKKLSEEAIKPTQFGFREKRGTTEFILLLNTIINKAKSQEEILFLTNLDMKKAYDSSPQDLVIKSMAKNGLSKESCLILRNIMRHHKSQCGPISANFSIQIRSGVLQGSILSPTEFNFFVNDIIDSNGGIDLSPNLKISNIAFADDITLLACSHDSQEAQLRLIENWAETHHMEFNPKKSITMKISSRTPVEQRELQNESQLTINDTVIPLLDQTKTIGITLNQSGAMSRQSSPNQALQAAEQWAKVKFRAPARILIPAYHSFAISSALYGNEVVPFSSTTTQRAKKFLRSVLSMPYHTNNAVMYEFMGLFRPETIAIKRKIRFAAKSLLSTTQTVEEAMTYATTEPSEWWISVKTEAESLGINLEPLIQLREDWLRNRQNKEKQEALAARCEITRKLLNQAIMTKEREWHEQTLPYISQRNVPGQGCLLLRKATAPGAHLLIKLRWDVNEHLRRHPRLKHLDHQCSLCTRNVQESNTHIIFDCKANQLDNKDLLARFNQARMVITSLYERNGPLNKAEYLQWLTGPKPLTRDGLDLTPLSMNKIVKAYKTIHHIRTNAFIRYRQMGVNSAHSVIANPRLTHDQKVQIWIKFIKARTPNQLDEVLSDANRKFNTVHNDKKWLLAWTEAAQSVNVDPSISPQVYQSFITNLNEIGPILCIAGTERRWQHLAITDPGKKFEFECKIRTLRRTARRIEWADTLPIWHWIHATPLAFAWILEKRTNIHLSKHYELIGLPSISHLKLKAHDDLRNGVRDDITKALTSYSARDNNPEVLPEMTISFGRVAQDWKVLHKNTKTRCLKTITETTDWRGPKKAFAYNFTTPSAMNQMQEEIRQNVIKQYAPGNTNETIMAHAQAWFNSILERSRTDQPQPVLPSFSSSSLASSAPISSSSPPSSTTTV
ncbi:MAG: reverse transcriptase family protein [Candidatus Paceibacterota bacterium]